MSGAVRDSLVRSFSGSISSARLVVKRVSRTLPGSVALSGSLSVVQAILLTSLSGSLGLSGALTVEKLAGLLLLTLTGSLGGPGGLTQGRGLAGEQRCWQAVAW